MNPRFFETYEANEKNAKTKSLFFRAFFTTLSIGLIACILFNIHINPWGNYGDEGAFILYNDRKAKSEYLSSLKKNEPNKNIDTFILGSSTVLSFKSSTVKKLWGGEVFNLGCFFAGSEESYSWLKHLVEELNFKPKRIIVGLETWSFSQHVNGPLFYKDYRRRFLNTPQLSKYIEGYSSFKNFCSKSFDSISWQQLQTSWTLKTRELKEQPDFLASSIFNVDGSAISYSKQADSAFIPKEINDFYHGLDYHKKRTQSESAFINKSLRLNVIPISHVRVFCPGNQLSKERLKRFEHLVAYCEKNDIKLIPILMPTHPYFYDILSSKTHHQQFLQGIREQVSSYAEQYRAIDKLIDASHIQKFDGLAHAFHDRFHMGPRNTDKLLKFVHKSSIK